MAHDAQIAKSVLLDREQQSPDSRSMYLDAEVIPLRVQSGERRQMSTIAEADLDNARCAPAEERIKILNLAVESDAVLRPQLSQGALLRIR
jgi:hypothetical protein